MGTQEYRANYRAAMQEANSQLAEMFREFEQLQHRKELLEDVLGSLEPFLASTASMRYEAPRYEAGWPEPTRFEAGQPLPAAAMRSTVNEPVRPAPFAPAADMIPDPIQNRINHALGLAVA